MGEAVASERCLTLVEKRRLAALEAIVDRELDGFIRVALALTEIRDRRLYRTDYATFEQYVQERFGLARRTAYGYIEAAAVQANLGEDVDLSLSHLRALAPLDEEGQRRVAELVEGLSLAAARRVIREWRRSQRVLQAEVDTPPLPSGFFRTIVADPPWRFDGNERGDGLASDHYPTLSADEVGSLPVGAISAADSHLYLWAPATKIPDALAVCESWGFRYVALLTWVKPGLGLGRWWRYATEHVVFGVRGRLPTRPNLRNWFEAKRGLHSAKPAEFYAIVERASPGPYLELFARRHRDGWTSWGNEIEGSLLSRTQSDRAMTDGPA